MDIGKLLEWIRANWNTILWAIAAIIAFIRAWQNGIGELGNKLIAWLRDVIKGELEDITEEQIKTAAAWLYETALSKMPDWLAALVRRLYPVEKFQEEVWQLWLDYLAELPLARSVLVGLFE